MDYKTVGGFASASLIEKRSEFIGSISPCGSEDEAIGFIEKIKRENRKARHNVYAYILRGGGISRYSDDGEPQGTGGVPTLETIKNAGLTDVCVVVTRYFGGILLGTGGLARAYSAACRLAIENAEILDMCSCSRFVIRCDYSLYGRIGRLLNADFVKVTNEDFSSDVTLTALVKAANAESLRNELINAANGRIDLSEETDLTENFA